MSKIEVKVPDIGDFHDIPIIEIMVKPGDTVKPEQSLMTLESDKAAMDVPSPAAGVVKEVLAKIGDKVSQGSLILTLEDAPAPAGKVEEKLTSQPAESKPTGAATEVKVPDIGDFHDVPVIEIMVKPGDAVKAEQPLMTLESDKAAMDVPSPSDGVVAELRVKIGDKVSQGSVDPDADLRRHRARPGAQSGGRQGAGDARRGARAARYGRREGRRRPQRPRPIFPAFTPAPRFAASRANWTSISQASPAPARRAASPRTI